MTSRAMLRTDKMASARFQQANAAIAGGERQYTIHDATMPIHDIGAQRCSDY
jgi:hypothetical protein